MSTRSALSAGPRLARLSATRDIVLSCFYFSGTSGSSWSEPKLQEPESGRMARVRWRHCRLLKAPRPRAHTAHRHRSTPPGIATLPCYYRYYFFFPTPTRRHVLWNVNKTQTSPRRNSLCGCRIPQRDCVISVFSYCFFFLFFVFWLYFSSSGVKIY